MYLGFTAKEPFEFTIDSCDEVLAQLK